MPTPSSMPAGLVRDSASRMAGIAGASDRLSVGSDQRRRRSAATSTCCTTLPGTSGGSTSCTTSSSSGRRTFISAFIAHILDRGLIDSVLARAAPGCTASFRTSCQWSATAGSSITTSTRFADKTWNLGLSLRSVQTGRLRQYVMFIVVGTIVFVRRRQPLGGDSQSRDSLRIRRSPDPRYPVSSIMFDFSNPAVFLSWLVFLPAVVALVIAFLPARGETIKRISLVATVVVFVMSLGMIFGFGDWPEVSARDGRDAEPVRLRLDSVVRHSIPDGHRRHQLSAGRADDVPLACWRWARAGRSRST